LLAFLFSLVRHENEDHNDPHRDHHCIPRPRLSNEVTVVNLETVMKPLFVLPLLSVVAMGQSAGTFTSTGSMITPRFSHTATLLPDGRVLIAGGNAVAFVGSPALSTNTAELYDPGTGAFTSTGKMSFADQHMGGILLPDGRVFFASFSNSAPLAAIELYNPSTGSFNVVGNAAAVTYVTTATLLGDGTVLVTGYTGNFSAFGTEIYDPIGGTSTPFANSLPEAPFAAVALADGRILLQFYERNAQIYDPVSGSFTDTGGLCCFDEPPQASLLLSRYVLFTGGNDDGGNENSVELYDPALNIFAGMKMPIARDGHTSTLLPDGAVLIAGGLQFANRSQPATATAEIYDTNAGFSRTGSLATGRADHAAVLLHDGRVLITGGSTFLGSGSPTLAAPINGLSSAEIYTPANLTPAASLLSLSGDGTGPGAIQHATTYQLVTPDNPAVAGEAVVIYCTGLIDGSVIPPRVSIGGRMAQVLWFGNTPGYPGLDQINVRIPSGVASGSAVPVWMNYVGRPSNEVSVGIRAGKHKGLGTGGR
jgi:hypothetical protein